MSESPNPDLGAQIKKIADHLVFLEKKLDTLLEQTKERQPSFAPKFGGGNRDFQRPRGNFGRSHDGPPRNGYGRPDRPQYGQGPRRSSHGGHGHGNHSQGKYFSNKPAR